MALSKNILASTGFTTTYHAIVEIRLDIANDASTVVVNSYKDLPAQQAGDAAAIQTRVSGGPASALMADPSGPLKAAYAALVASGTFANATDA